MAGRAQDYAINAMRVVAQSLHVQRRRPSRLPYPALARSAACPLMEFGRREYSEVSGYAELRSVAEARRVAKEVPTGGSGAKRSTGSSTPCRWRTNRRGWLHSMNLTGAVLVKRGSDIMYEAYGDTADPATGAQCEPETRFQIASVSKQFAAAAALLLVEDGVIRLTDRVTDWLAGCPATWADITLHHLLSHTSGLPHWDGIPHFDVETPPSREEIVTCVMRLLPTAGPGREWRYSSPGYVLTALVIEQASRLPYADFLCERIFLPLGLASTSVGPTPPRDAARGRRHGRIHDVVDLSHMPGTGDVWTTARDLAQWARALEKGKLVAPESLRMMFTPHSQLHSECPPFTATGYGYGVFLGDLAGHRACFHDGDNTGYQSLLVRLPEHDVSIVVLANDEVADPYATMSDLFATPTFLQ